jgi:hypothetical protein
MGPVSGDLVDQNPSFFGGRPGPLGGRGYIVGDYNRADPSAAAGPSASVAMKLYEHSNSGVAETFWRDHPPEKAHKDVATNIADRDEAFVRDGLPRWRFDIPDSGGFEWQGICLTGAYDETAPCAGFFGWVRFCRWTMEIDFAPPAKGGWRLDDERVPKIMQALAETTAQHAGCAAGVQ